MAFSSSALSSHVSLDIIVFQGYRATLRPTEDSAIELVGSFQITADTPLTSSTNQRSIIEIARNRLLALERSIERRYLKPPLGRRSVATY